MAFTPQTPSMKRSFVAVSQRSFKTILLGDSGVGKTSLFVRLTQDNFNTSGNALPQPTL